MMHSLPACPAWVGPAACKVTLLDAAWPMTDLSACLLVPVVPQYYDMPSPSLRNALYREMQADVPPFKARGASILFGRAARAEAGRGTPMLRSMHLASSLALSHTQSTMSTSCAALDMLLLAGQPRGEAQPDITGGGQAALGGAGH